MSRDAGLTKTDRPSYQILKWVGGGGFGQVFKVKRNNEVVACKQIRFEDAEAALDEYEHMTYLFGGPHIAALHNGLEYNTRTKTLSFFMDYYKGKDLERQIHILRGAGARFLESQILSIGIQIAEALYFCHSKNVLHQDMKTMNVLLKDPWNPLYQLDVPELFVADFGIASHEQNVGTRLMDYRGTPGYEAPEIRGPGPAASSAESDIYALGCILYRLITLDDPAIFDDVKPRDISKDYCDELLCIVSSMLGSSRFDRPSAMEVMMQLISLIDVSEDAASIDCQLCGQTFISLNALRKHRKKTGHLRGEPLRPQNNRKKGGMELRGPKVLWRWEDEGSDNVGPIIIGPVIAPQCVDPATIERAQYDEDDFRVKGIARVKLENTADGNVEPLDLPCVVCMRHFETKKRFYGHLHDAHHYRNPDYVQKRRAENEVYTDTAKRLRA